MDIAAKIKDFLTKLQKLPDKQKKIILWVIVIILALILGFFWFKSAINKLEKLGENVSQIKLPEIQTPIAENPSAQTDETADWKTYTNDEYGFEIKYPNSWYFKEVEKGIVDGGIYFSPYPPDEKDETGGIAFTSEALNISANNLAEKSSLLEYVKNYLNLSVATKFEIENIKVDGADGIKVRITCDGVGCGNPHWFVMKEEKVYIFNSGLSDKIDVFEKIISTFKFTK